MMHNNKITIKVNNKCIMQKVMSEGEYNLKKQMSQENVSKSTTQLGKEKCDSSGIHAKIV